MASAAASAKRAASNALKATRVAIEKRIAECLVAHDQAKLDLVYRDVELGKALNEYRDTFTDGTTAEQSEAFNKQALRLCVGWSYANIKRVQQAARLGVRIPDAAEQLAGSIDAMSYTERFEDDHAAAIIGHPLVVKAVADKTNVAAAVKEAATLVVPSLKVSSSDKAKAERDAAKRKENVIASAIAKDLHKVLKASASFDPAIRVALLQAMRTGAKMGATHGPLTERVIASSVKAWNESKSSK